MTGDNAKAHPCVTDGEIARRTDTIRPPYYRIRCRVRALDKLDEPRASTEVEIECQDLIEALNLDFNGGNVLKYLFRAGRKTETVIDDVKKVVTYAKFLLEDTLRGVK